MKKVKGLSVVMAALLAAQGGMNPAVFAIEPNGSCEKQGNVGGEDRGKDSGNGKMKEQVQGEIFRILFFRPDRIDYVKQFLPSSIQWETIPSLCRTFEFLNLLKKNEEGDPKSFSKEEKENEEQKGIEQIIEEDNLELLQKEFRQDSNIDIKDSFFEVKNMKIPILHYCVMKKAMKCFKFLLLNGADPSQKLEDCSYEDYREYEDWDCMSVAICFGEWEMMKILEERGINKLKKPSVWEAAALTHRNNLLKLFISNKDQIDNFEECLEKAMFGAVKGNNIKEFIRLLSEGADINALDLEGRTPLLLAVEYNADKVAEILISKGAAGINAKDIFGWTPLHVAARYDANKVAEVLISKRADINAKSDDGRTPLHIALEEGYNEVAELLISKGAYINEKDNNGRTPLHIAAAKDTVKVAELLISKGADINAKDKWGRTPLHIAAEYNADKVVGLLLSKGADINAKDNEGKTPLHYVARNYARQVTEVLISEGVDINALYIEAEKNTEKVAEVLISKGADINAKDSGGKTPLHYAARNDARQVAEVLISKGADINAKDNEGSTPLHVAMKNRSDNLVDLLVSQRADVNAKDKNGCTPFHVAAEIYWHEKFEFLIDHGADRNAENDRGMTPFGLALCKGLQKARGLSDKQMASKINEIKTLTRKWNL